MLFAQPEKPVDYMEEWKSLSDEQKMLLHKTFIKAKDFDLGYTMTAIAWKESKAGKELVNWNLNSKGEVVSIDCGVFQNNSKTVISRLDGNQKHTKSNIAKVCRNLVLDYDFSLFHAVEEIKYWESLYPDQWKKIWASYNGGFNNSSKVTLAYADDISKRIKFLAKVM